MALAKAAESKDPVSTGDTSHRSSLDPRDPLPSPGTPGRWPARPRPPALSPPIPRPQPERRRDHRTLRILGPETERWPLGGLTCRNSDALEQSDSLPWLRDRQHTIFPDADLPDVLMLARDEPTSDDTTSAWTRYLAQWTAGNPVRTLAALAATVNLTLAHHVP